MASGGTMESGAIKYTENSKHLLLQKGVAVTEEGQKFFDFHNRVLDEYLFYQLIVIGAVKLPVIDFWRAESVRLPILSNIARLF